MINSGYIILIIFIIFAIIYLFTKEGFDNPSNDDEFALIKKYLLNESPLYNKNKPKLWIHTSSEINARNWSSFQDRNSTELNQPYIELTIQSIINHCSADFTICLINDDSFSKLIPQWNTHDNIDNIPEPKRQLLRQKGLLELLYYYGGIIVPNSFICFRNLEELFNSTGSITPFVVETINHASTHRASFIPSLDFIGVRLTRDATIKRIIDAINNTTTSISGFSNESLIVGSINTLLVRLIKENALFMWDASMIGIKSSADGSPILTEDLFEESSLNIVDNAFGILLDANQILKRHKYQWLAYVKHDGAELKGNMILAKYLNQALKREYPIVSNDINVI
jgi:hypothetical protein